jgi:surfeit locus 1 family protein
LNINKLTKFLIFNLLAIIILLSLGTWQLERLRWKTDLIESMKENISLPPVKINSSIISNIKNYNYRRFKLYGYYLYDKNITIYSKVVNGKVGRHLVTPFKTKFGYILINRGFVPENYKIESNVIKQDKNTSINGIVKFQQKINYFTPSNSIFKNEWYYINIEEISTYFKLDLNNFYIIEENNPNERYPLGSQYNINIPNDHLQYAITWFSLALALSIFLHLLWRKNVN